MKRRKVHAKNKSWEQFKNFALVILAVVLLVIIAMNINGTQVGTSEALVPNPYAVPTTAGVGSIPYVFVKGMTMGTSWGETFYSDGSSPAVDIGLHGYLPVLAGNYIYAIKFLTDAPQMVTQPVKYNITTKEITALTPASPPYNYNLVWRIMDANSDGTYLIGQFNSFSIYRNGTKLKTIGGGFSMIGTAELSDDSKYVVYTRNNKVYRQLIGSRWGGRTDIPTIGSASEVATNANGSALIYNTRIGTVDRLYYWNSANSTTVTPIQATNTANIAPGLGMNAGGLAVWAGSKVGDEADYHVYLYDGTTKDLTPTANNSFPAPWFARILGNNIIYGHGSALYGGDTSGSFTLLGTFPPLVEQCSWGE